MAGKIIEPLWEGFRDALRLFVAIVRSPASALSAFDAFIHHEDPRRPGYRRPKAR
jgi:hypothetical protein